MPSPNSPSDTVPAALPKLDGETPALTGASPSRDQLTRPQVIVLLAAALALLAKLYCAWTTVGTNDSVLFRFYGEGIVKYGLAVVYEVEPMFNHTPLVGEFCRWAFHTETDTGIPFFFLLRVPGIFADFGAVLALLWLNARTALPRLWIVGVFSLSPVAFMISGYHGNLDPVLTFFLLVTTCACVGRKWFWCAVAFGLACHIKVVALLLAPAFFFFWWSRRCAWKFGAVVGILVVAGWIQPLLECPTAFVTNVLGYKSYWGIWGITWALRTTGFHAFQTVGFNDLHGAQVAIMSALKYLVIGIVLRIAWRRRETNPTGIFCTIALTWAGFFTFSPGVGAQYLIWFTPFVLMVSSRWYLALTAASSVFLFAFYHVISGPMPWFVGMSREAQLSGWVPWTILPWLTMGAFLVWAWRRGMGERLGFPVAAGDADAPSVSSLPCAERTA